MGNIICRLTASEIENMTKPAYARKYGALRPDVAKLILEDARKRAIALQLRALRKSRGMTQRDVERLSGLTQPAISRLESPSGALPHLETVERYVHACSGKVELVITTE
jgi:DNA-binding phage protein